MGNAKTTPAATTAPAISAAAAMPALGSQAQVMLPEGGGALINNETHQLFAPGVATPQLVTLTTLRRLADGDLVLVG